jgi:hypothetical protein
VSKYSSESSLALDFAARPTGSERSSSNWKEKNVTMTDENLRSLLHQGSAVGEPKEVARLELTDGP